MPEPSALETAQLECDAAIKRLYEVFGSYRFRADMPCCIPHCFDQSEIDALGEKPLRFLELKTLQRFAFKFLTTCGEVQDFKYFLPRLLELTANTRMGFVNEILLGKLDYANWHTWQDFEQQAVNNFLWAWWHLELELDDSTPEDCLTALCSTGNDPISYLRAWRDLESTRHEVMLARFVNQHATTILAGREFNGFVGIKATRSIQAFLREPETRSRLEHAFLECDNPEYRETLAFAEQLLRF